MKARLSRAVFDTNVLVSSYWSPSGPPAKAVGLWRGGSVEMCLSPGVLQEYRRAFLRVLGKRGMTVREIDGEIALMRRKCAFSENPPRIPGCVPGDADDEKFVECAVAAGARYLVSGDSHLLAANVPGGITALRPSEFVRVFSA